MTRRPRKTSPATRAAAYMAGECKRLAAWLQEHTP